MFSRSTLLRPAGYTDSLFGLIMIYCTRRGGIWRVIFRKIQVHIGIMQCEVPPNDETRHFSMSCGYMPVQVKIVTFT